jgi:hypothetical protein
MISQSIYCEKLMDSRLSAVTFSTEPRAKRKTYGSSTDRTCPASHSPMYYFRSSARMKINGRQARRSETSSSKSETAADMTACLLQLRDWRVTLQAEPTTR